MALEVQREEFMQAISASMSACKQGEHLAVIVIKILDLHKFNATMGYAKTDQLFEKAFDALTVTVKKAPVICRVGSASIGIIVSGIKFPHLIDVGLERILGAVCGPFQLDDQEIPVGVKMGASLFPSDCSSADELLLHAEAALRTCGERGSEYKVYDELQVAEAGQWEMEAQLKTALEKGQLAIQYQPQVRVADASTAGFEALLRWNHPEYGAVSPTQFIPLAESGGSLNEITEWLLLTALRETIGSLDNAEGLTISLNVSTSTLFDPGFPFVIESAISLWGAVYEHFILEITESVFMQDFDAAKTILQQLRDKGAKISLDDFGTGYSSLAYFKQLPVDELKIDRVFVDQMAKDSDDFKLVDVMIQMAHKFGMVVVAEGVEDEETLDALRDLECDIAQGYHISRPVGADDLQPWLDGAPVLANVLEK